MPKNFIKNADDHADGTLFLQAQALAAQSRYSEALMLYARLLGGGVNNIKVQEAASVALLAIIADGSMPEIGQAQGLAELLRLLILQPDLPDAPPIFHHAIASRHSSGIADTLPGVARVLDTALGAFWDEGCRDKMFLLMLLLLRESLGNWADQEVISRWHVERLASFTDADMAIPYNVMFDSMSFRRNVEDVRGLVDVTPMRVLAERLTLRQLILFQWMTRSNFLDRQLPELIGLIGQRAEHGEISVTDSGPARSLLLRARASGRTVSPDLLRHMGEDFANLAVNWPVAPFLRPDMPDSRAAVATQRLNSLPWQAANAGVRIVRARVPYLQLGRRARVALCVSGQLRGYRTAYASWIGTLLPGAEVETFVHSWRKIGRSGAEPFRAYLPFMGRHFQEIYRQHATRVGLPEMQHRYPTLFATLADTGRVTESEIKAFYDTDDVVLEDDGAEQFAGWTNSAKMHYKMAACFDLVKADQREFDLVLRIRPDKVVRIAAFAWRDMIVSARGRRVLYSDTSAGLHYGDLMIGDQAAIAAPDAMALCCAAYRINGPLSQMEVTGFRGHFVGHATLAATCWNNAISVEKMPVRFGVLAEAEPLPAAIVAGCLETDAANRMDPIDEAFLNALSRDRAR